MGEGAVETKHQCIKLQAEPDKLSLHREKEKLAEAKAVSSNSVSSLGKDESPNNNKCCAGSKYCVADDPDINLLTELHYVQWQRGFSLYQADSCQFDLHLLQMVLERI